MTEGGRAENGRFRRVRSCAAYAQQLQWRAEAGFTGLTYAGIARAGGSEAGGSAAAARPGNAAISDDGRGGAGRDGGRAAARGRGDRLWGPPRRARVPPLPRR